MSAKTATSYALEIPELLSAILCHFDCSDLWLSARRVNKSWKAVVEETPGLQWKTWRWTGNPIRTAHPPTIVLNESEGPIWFYYTYPAMAKHLVVLREAYPELRSYEMNANDNWSLYKSLIASRETGIEVFPFFNTGFSQRFIHNKILALPATHFSSVMRVRTFKSVLEQTARTPHATLETAVMYSLPYELDLKFFGNCYLTRPSARSVTIWIQFGYYSEQQDKFYIWCPMHLPGNRKKPEIQHHLENEVGVTVKQFLEFLYTTKIQEGAALGEWKVDKGWLDWGNLTVEKTSGDEAVILKWRCSIRTEAKVWGHMKVEDRRRQIRWTPDEGLEES